MPAPTSAEVHAKRVALIRAEYPNGDVPTLCKALGVSLTRLQNIACGIGVKRDKRAGSSRTEVAERTAAIRKALLLLADRPKGVGAQEIMATGHPASAVYRVAEGMVTAGELHKAAISRKVVIFFTRPAAAAAVLTAAGRAVRTAPVTVRQGPGPAYLPGAPVITLSTKWTFAPPPAERPLRTNTFMFS